MRRFSSRFSLLVIGLLTIVTMVVGCTREASPPLTPVKLSTSKNMWCALSLIAADQEYFRQEGLDVQVDFTDGGRYCMDAILSNSAQLGNIVETNVSFLGYTGNDDVVVVANQVTSTGAAVIARKSHGITKPAELKGKRLAYTPATQGDIFAYRFLKANGLNPTDIEARKLQPKAIAPALAAGEIDAASTWEPFVYACRKAIGDDAVVFHDGQAHTGYLHLAARRDWAEKNPHLVQAAIRALQRAEIFVREHRDQAESILAKQMNVDLDLVQSTWDYYDMKVTCSPQTLVDVITAEGIWVQEMQPEFQGKPLPDYTRYVDPKYFDAANRTGR